VSDELSGRSVLVADDDEDNAELLAVIVQGAGAQARMAGSASAVLALIADGWRPDAFLLDIGLPDMDGYELLEEIRKDPALSVIPAVAISGYATERDKARAAECGFAVHVSKPYDGEAVVHLVAKLTSPKPEAPTARRVREALASGGVHAALAFLNKHASHRFTGLYRFDGDTLRSLSLFDREDPSALVGDDAPMSETYCAVVARERAPFVTADATVDPRLVEHPSRLSVRSYCGVLLRNSDSTPFGSLCHFDAAPVAAPGDETLDLLEGAAPIIAALLAE
jgi:CheY-like chemotaxis protein